MFDRVIAGTFVILVLVCLTATFINVAKNAPAAVQGIVRTMLEE